jgi:hypothetical protein
MQLKFLLISLIFLFTAACSTNETSFPSQKTLNFYSDQSNYTDPGKYECLYEELPESLDELCSLIKHQLIHPVEIGDLKNKLPKDRHYEDPKYPTVEKILEGLLEFDERGFTMDRKREDRLIIACYHHCLLLASVLRHRGIPVRIRTGFARYFEKKYKVRFGHAICEVWDAEQQKWIWVDPDRQYIDMEHDRFELPQKAWKDLRRNRLKTKMYMGGFSKGEYSVVHILVQDIVSVVKTETQYWDEPVFMDKIFKNIDELDEDKLLVLDQFANLLEAADDSLEQLIALYNNTGWIQPSGSTWEETVDKFGIEF